MSAPEKRDNYQITLVRTRELFLKYDQRAIIDRFSLNADERYLYLTFVARPYRIERATGAIEFLKDRWRPAGHGDGMTIYDILCDAKPGARISGRFQNAWNQRNVSSAPNGSLFQDSADCFSGKCAQLSAACERLGGERAAGTGDFRQGRHHKPLPGSHQAPSRQQQTAGHDQWQIWRGRILHPAG